VKALVLALALSVAAPGAVARPAALKDPLLGLGFLLGQWKSVSGKVAATGGTSKGTSRFTVAADGWMLLRQDHTDTFDNQGKPTGSFDQVMLIYFEGGKLRADYGDGEGRVIHYASVEMDPGRMASFVAPASATAPGFMLNYTATTSADPSSGPDLAVEFDMLRADGHVARNIAGGVLTKAH
jgi:hypothetical protein